MRCIHLIENHRLSARPPSRTSRALNFGGCAGTTSGETFWLQKFSARSTSSATNSQLSSRVFGCGGCAWLCGRIAPPRPPPTRGIPLGWRSIANTQSTSNHRLMPPHHCIIRKCVSRPRFVSKRRLAVASTRLTVASHRLKTTIRDDSYPFIDAPVFARL